MVTRAKMAAAFALLCLPALPAGAQPPSVPPPSPFGDDPHGAYDGRSHCWVWDEAQKSNAYPFLFSTSGQCDGRALEGPASVHWTYGPRNGETWDGQFANGRFTGTAIHEYARGRSEVRYQQGVRSGPSFVDFGDGGSLQESFVNGVLDGTKIEIYADGSRDEAHFAMGKHIGTDMQTFADGSRVECSEPDGCRDAPGGILYVAGKPQPGRFINPRTDPKNTPAVYPPIAIRLGETGSVVIGGQILKDGTIRDAQIMRSSGYQRLDQSALASARLWAFRPATLDSQPVDCYWRMLVSFHLRD